jgi:[ribosomal protein S5]-alanine N-acetyltransferase
MGFERLEITGEQVRLRPVRASDAETHFKLVKSDEILSCILWEGPKDISTLKATYQEWELGIPTEHGCHLAIETFPSLALVGNISIRFPSHPQQADIGYWLGVPYWGKGYMTDAVRLACYVSFKYLNAVRVCAQVFVGNTGSRRVLEKNGFSLDGTLRYHNFKRGTWRDEWFFSLLNGEWQSRRDKYAPIFEDIVLKTGDRK